MLKKNLAIFASYDSEQIVHEYVLTYLRELSKVADIIFVSDNSLSQAEQEKLKSYTLQCICYHHGMYDFGSYKQGYLYAYENHFLEKYDGLILCNDSVFGPFYPFAKILDTINSKNCDFGGCMKFLYREGKDTHIQSYFIYLKKLVFMSSVFHDFMVEISKQDSKESVIEKYEIGLSKRLESKGFSSYGLLENSINLPYTDDAVAIIERGFPFLKKSLFDYHFFKYDAYCRKICDYKKIISKICSNYDINQIENYNVKKYGLLCSKLYPLALKYHLIFDIKKVFFQKKVTKKGRLMIKILRIPVYSKSIINKQGEV